MADSVSAQMVRLTIGAYLGQAVHTAAVLGIADEIADGPRSVDELAAACGANEEALYRLLRALATAEVFVELDGRRFGLSPLGELLRSDVPGSIRDWARMVGRPIYRDAWTGLPDSVRTGESAFERAHGRTLFEYFGDHPEEARAFDATMAASVGRLAGAIVQAYDFGGASTVVDVGGGRGALLDAILATDPELRGVLYDLPHVVAAAGPGERRRVVGGDFFDEVPAGGDVYLLSSVIHDWDDDRAVRILTGCRAALGEAGRVILAEWVLPDEPGGEDALLAVWADLTMLVMTPGGRQRTRADFERLLRRAGLRLTRVIPTEAGCSLIEAVPTGQTQLSLK